jgi:hypothetical protein
MEDDLGAHPRVGSVLAVADLYMVCVLDRGRILMGMHTAELNASLFHSVLAHLMLAFAGHKNPFPDTERTAVAEGCSRGPANKEVLLCLRTAFEACWPPATHH